MADEPFPFVSQEKRMLVIEDTPHGWHGAQTGNGVVFFNGKTPELAPRAIYCVTLPKGNRWQVMATEVADAGARMLGSASVQHPAEWVNKILTKEIGVPKMCDIVFDKNDVRSQIAKEITADRIRQVGNQEYNQIDFNFDLPGGLYCDILNLDGSGEYDVYFRVVYREIPDDPAIEFSLEKLPGGSLHVSYSTNMRSFEYSISLRLQSEEDVARFIVDQLTEWVSKIPEIPHPSEILYEDYHRALCDKQDIEPLHYPGLDYHITKTFLDEHWSSVVRFEWLPDEGDIREIIFEIATIHNEEDWARMTITEGGVTRSEKVEFPNTKEACAWVNRKTREIHHR